jgi:D-lactate dehydrogenase (cytochrome)
MDNHMMDAINHSGLSERSYPIKDSLFFKFQGSPSCISETSKLVKGIVKKHGSSHFNAARNKEEADELWNHRKVALWSTLGWPEDAEARLWTTDVCVPPSQLPELIGETKKDLEASGIKSTIVGHVGDGNFHAFLLFTNDEELEKVRGAVHRMVHRALALDGTCTGEHGVGVGKKEYLVEELGEGTVELMKAIKKAIDPLELFNPGKVCVRDYDVTLSYTL